MCLLAAQAGQASQPSAEVSDVAARIEYGFLTADLRTIQTARDALKRTASEDSWGLYFDALGAYRLALLQGDGGHRRTVNRLIQQCLQSSRAARAADPDFGESVILTAACLSLTSPSDPNRAKMHHRKVAALLGEARNMEPHSPRLPLVSALVKTTEPGEADGRAEDIQQLLEQARLAFDQQGVGFSNPDWGEPETLALLGEIHLRRGDLRAARDAVEQALMIAPDYHLARELESRIGAAR